MSTRGDDIFRVSAAAERRGVRHASMRNRILRAVSESGQVGRTASEVAGFADVTERTARKYLDELITMGRVVSDGQRPAHYFIRNRA